MIVNHLLPQQADNAYRGHKFGLWVFALVVLLEVGMGLYAMLNGYVVAVLGDGISLRSFTLAGAQTVVSLYALWGIAHLMICLVCILALARYRALIPLMFVLLLIEHLSRVLVLRFLPLSTTETGGRTVGLSPVPYGFLVLILVGLVLSLRRGQAHSP